VSIELVGLALLMGAVTYPSRALPLLAPGLDRLPPIALAYLRLVGPAVLGALAAVNTAIVVDEAGRGHVHLGVDWLAVAVCVGLVAWRKNLFLGLIAAVILAATVRALNLA
jgi:branched-subunit amino acid transport protein